MNRLSAKVAIKSLIRRFRDTDAGDARQRAEKMWATLHERKPGWEHVYQSSWQWPIGRWSFFPETSAWRAEIRELPPHLNLAYQGDINAVIVAARKGSALRSR